MKKPNSEEDARDKNEKHGGIVLAVRSITRCFIEMAASSTILGRFSGHSDQAMGEA